MAFQTDINHIPLPGDKMKQAKGLNALYSAVQGIYWMSYCASVTFAVIFLVAHGSNNTEAGFVLSTGCLLGALLGVLLGALIDRHPGCTVPKLFPCLMIGQALTLALMLILQPHGVVLGVIYSLYMACFIAVGALDLKLYGDLSSNSNINYGLARGMGSLAYVIASVALGMFVKHFSANILLYAGIVICIGEAIIHWIIFQRIPAASTKPVTERGTTLIRFLKGNRGYCLLLLGTVLLFVPHSLQASFLINIVRAVGGNEADMGLVDGFTAAVEIPVMLLYAVLAQRLKHSRLLRISLVMLTFKVLAMAAAKSIGGLYAASLLQMPSYALYIVAVVPYAAMVTDSRDFAKAQSLINAMPTVGSVISGLIGGRLLDILPVSQVLYAAAVLSLLGTVLALLGTRKASDKVEREQI